MLGVTVTRVMILASLHRTAQTKFLRLILFQGINIPTPGGTDHTPPTMVKDLGDISNDHNPTAIPTATEAAVSEGTHCIPHPATTAAHAPLWLMDIPITIHVVTHPTSIVAPHLALTTSTADVTYTTIPWTGASLNSAPLTALHRKHSQEKPCTRPSTSHIPQHSRNVIIQDSQSDSSSDLDINSDP